jgi:type VI secretion system protein VasG
VLDTACAKVALGQSATPALIESLQRRLERIAAETGALEREQAAGGAHEERLQELDGQRAALRDELAALQARWESEKALAAQIGEARAGLERSLGRTAGGSAAAGADAGAAQEGAGGTVGQARDIQALLRELRALQGEAPMVPVQVDGNVVAEIVAGWTGIPLGKMVKDEIQAVLRLRPALEERVIGQPHAIEAVAQRVRTARANLDDPNKPKGVFLFVGPSGIGKTETALALADALYGGERKMVTINMSEYQEAHSVSGLKGSPPGYVGYGEGGVLTEAVRRNPYSVVLLDEVEKAHPDVLELFFQVFDKGVMDDAEGREIDFRNTIIILTSNVGSATMMQACLNKEDGELPAPDELEALIRPQLVKAFKPAFLGRLKVVPYYPLGDDVLADIIRLKLDRIGQRVAANHKAAFHYDDALVEAVLARCTEVDSGARNVDNILNGTLLPEIAEAVLAKMAEGSAIGRIEVTADQQGKFSYSVA